MPILLKYILTAAVVVAVSEFAKRSDKLGSLIGALPLVTVLAMIWLFIEAKDGQHVSKVANHAYYTFWYVIPTLPMFLVMSMMVRRGVNFWLSLGIYVGGTMILFYLSYLVLKRFGINLA